MVKIEIEVKDSGSEKCSVTIKKPKKLKNSTVTELRTANVIHTSIGEAMLRLGKERKSND